jgi:hypothetical protein
MLKVVLFLRLGSLAVVGVFGLRLLWASRTPSRAPVMPEQSMWMPGPRAPLDLSARGVWVGCWLDQARLVDRCRVADYRGNIQFDEESVPLAGSPPVADTNLRLKRVGTMKLWTWVETERRQVPVVRLENGTVLVPTRDARVLQSRFAH